MKSKLSAISSICILLALGACGSSVEKKTSGEEPSLPAVELQGYSYDALASVPDSDVIDTEGGKYWRLTGSGMLPVKIAGKDVSVLRDSLERLAGVTVIDESHSSPIFDSPAMKEMGLKPTDLSPKTTEACSSNVNQLSVVLCTPAVVVWKDYSYTYMCRSAHGLYNTTFVNYGIADGKILSISDLMKPGYEKALTERIRSKLAEEKVPLLVSPEEIGIPKDFEITTQGIRFLYGLYEIAAYVEGEVSVSFDAYEIEDLLAPGVNARYFSLIPD